MEVSAQISIYFQIIVILVQKYFQSQNISVIRVRYLVFYSNTFTTTGFILQIILKYINQEFLCPAIRFGIFLLKLDDKNIATTIIYLTVSIVHNNSNNNTSTINLSSPNFFAQYKVIWYKFTIPVQKLQSSTKSLWCLRQHLNVLQFL